MAKVNIYFVSPFLRVLRSPVPLDKIDWKVPYDDYRPTRFTLDNFCKSWADPPVDQQVFYPKWNQLDGNIDRRSHVGPYQVLNGYPLNPLGRTGIEGKGVLGRWGPNHAADPVVTRWKRDKRGNKVKATNESILQFVAIRRRDTKEWAIPGGMVDPGELVSTTLRREFGEEALNSLEMNSEEKNRLEKKLKQFFEKSGVEIYRGPVDDPRNTDNAWMETIVYNFHDETGETLSEFNLNAGDDAESVKWLDIERGLKLYANHSSFVQKVAERLLAHW